MASAPCGPYSWRIPRPAVMRSPGPGRRSFGPIRLPPRKGRTSSASFASAGRRCRAARSRETSFTTWLEIGLRATDPGRQWEVVNCGGVSYASYRLVPILQEVLGYAPDLIILYTGHNEFLEDRAYDHIKSRPAAVTRALEILLWSRTGSVLCSAYQRFRNRTARAGMDRPPMLEAEVQALLDYRGGLESYHRDEKWRRDVIRHFAYNLRRMVHLANVAGVPLLLANPACNLRDCPPFKVAHRDDIAPAERSRWESLLRRRPRERPDQQVSGHRSVS